MVRSSNNNGIPIRFYCAAQAFGNSVISRLWKNSMSTDPPALSSAPEIKYVIARKRKKKKKKNTKKKKKKKKKEMAVCRLDYKFLALQHQGRGPLGRIFKHHLPGRSHDVLWPSLLQSAFHTSSALLSIYAPTLQLSPFWASVPSPCPADAQHQAVHHETSTRSSQLTKVVDAQLACNPCRNFSVDLHDHTASA